MLKKLELNRDVIKYIAMITMLLNHIGNVFVPSGTWLHIILVSVGYFTAPTMLYFMVEGYHYTRSKQKYLLRLFIFGVLSQVPYSLAFSDGDGIQFKRFNMMFTLCICFLLIWNIDMTSDRRRQSLLLGIAVFASIYCDWQLFAPVFIYLFYRAGEDMEKVRRAFLINALIFGSVTFLNYAGTYPGLIAVGYAICGMAGVLLSGLFITTFYNGKRMQIGTNFSKWFFYLFYPVHLLVLGLIKFYM